MQNRVEDDDVYYDRALLCYSRVLTIPCYRRIRQDCEPDLDLDRLRGIGRYLSHPGLIPTDHECQALSSGPKIVDEAIRVTTEGGKTCWAEDLSEEVQAKSCKRRAVISPRSAYGSYGS